MDKRKVVYAKNYPFVIRQLLKLIKKEIKPNNKNTQLLSDISDTIDEMDYIAKKCYIIKKD